MTTHSERQKSNGFSSDSAWNGSISVVTLVALHVSHCQLLAWTTSSGVCMLGSNEFYSATVDTFNNGCLMFFYYEIWLLAAVKHSVPYTST